MMQTESKHHTVFIIDVLSDNNRSDSMLEMKLYDIYFQIASNNLYCLDQSDMF